MIAIAAKDLSKSYGVDIIFKDVSFTIEEKEKVGIVGPNGTGKSTLFSILTGKLPADSGEYFTMKDSKIAHMEQNVNIMSEKNILEFTLEVFEKQIKLEKIIDQLHEKIAETAEDADLNSKYLKEYSEKIEEFENINGYSYMSLAKGTLIGLGFKEDDFKKKVSVLSGGEKSRLLLAKMLLSESDIMLLDEPTNHLDMNSINWLENYLSNQDKTVIVISHDRFFLDALTTKTIDMEGGTSTVYNLPYSEFIVKKEEDYEQKLKEYAENQAEIKRQQDIIDKLRAYGREKHIKRARSREKALQKMEKKDKPVKAREAKEILFTAKVKSGRDVLAVRDLSKSYPNKPLFSGINFDIYRGEKIALLGANGTGKTTIFDILLGKNNQDSGDVKFGTNVHTEYFSQEREDLNMENSVFEEISDTYPSLNNTQIRTYLAAFLFTGDEVFKEIKTLSGGEKSRVSLLKMMLSNSNFILLDEPTNHLDIMSKEVLENALISSDLTVLVISHDRYFLDKVPDRILELENGNITEYLGGYSDMLEKKSELAERQLPSETFPKEETKTQKAERRKKEKEQLKQIKDLKNKEKEITDKITQIEIMIEGFDEELCKEQVYTDPEKTKEIVYKKNDAQKQLDELLEKWEEINEHIEEMED